MGISCSGIQKASALRALAKRPYSCKAHIGFSPDLIFVSREANKQKTP